MLAELLIKRASQLAESSKLIPPESKPVKQINTGAEQHKPKLLNDPVANAKKVKKGILDPISPSSPVMFQNVDDQGNVKTAAMYTGNSIYDGMIKILEDSQNHRHELDKQRRRSQWPKLLDENSPNYKPSTNTLLYNGDTFHVLNDKGESLYSVNAWSGRDKYMNKAEYTHVPNGGPIPAGSYTLGQRQTNMQRDFRHYLGNALANSRWFGKLTRHLSGDYRDYKKYNDPALKSDMFANNPYGWGEYRFALHPDEGTDTLGRTNMYLHGGDEPGSLGCVDIMGNLKDILENRPELGLGKGMKLVVDYNRKNIPTFKPVK